MIRIDPGEEGPLAPYEDGETLGEAVEDIFPIDAPPATLWWHDVGIPLGYRYDVGTLLDDIVAMLEAIRSSDSGERYIAWPANTFRVDWTLAWGDGQLRVEARWESVAGGLEARLQLEPILELPCAEFLAAWTPLLKRCDAALLQAGVTLRQVPDLRRLRALLQKEPSPRP